MLNRNIILNEYIQDFNKGKQYSTNAELDYWEEKWERKKKQMVVKPEIQLACKMIFFILHEDIKWHICIWIGAGACCGSDEKPTSNAGVCGQHKRNST